MSVEHRSLEHTSAIPSYERAVAHLVERFTNEETPLGDGERFEDILWDAHELDASWREDGFEGLTAFLTPQGYHVGIGRQIHPDEMPRYVQAWASGEYPVEINQNKQLRDQTYRITYRGETRDITIPTQFQVTEHLQFRGFEGGIDGVLTLYATQYNDQETLAPGMRWLTSLFGYSMGLTYGMDRLRSLNVQQYEFSKREFPSLEDVALGIQAIQEGEVETSYPTRIT